MQLSMFKLYTELRDKNIQFFVFSHKRILEVKK
jgi:hypothetical protein